MKFSTYVIDEFKKDKTEPLNAHEICAKYTTDVVSSCIFNADAQSFTEEKPEIREMGRQLFNFENPVLMMKFFVLSLVPSLGKILKITFVSKKVEQFFTSLMFQAIKLREKSEIKRDDYLAYLIALKNKKEISELDMAAHGVTFFIDGFETSSVAISHALYEVFLIYLK